MYYFFIVITCVAGIPLENIELGHCGKMKNALSASMEDEDDDNDMRIVGGFEAPEPVPWFVMLKINTQNGSFNGHQCGATLITTKFILTAAHCICNEYVNYCYRADDHGHVSELQKDIDIVALLGLIFAYNLQDLSKSQSMERHLRFIVKAVIHQDFMPTSATKVLPDGPDIALLKLDRPLPR